MTCSRAMTTADAVLLRRLERYYDSVPRTRSRVEEVGPFTLFVAESGWPYYARPRLGKTAAITPDDVRRILARQREIGVPQAIEWVDETTPGLLETVQTVGVEVDVCPLLVLGGAPHGSRGTTRLLDPEKPGDVTDLAFSRAAVSVGFGSPGTATGAAGIAERGQALAETDEGANASVLEGMRAGRLRLAAVYDAADLGVGPVGGGSYSPVDGVAEIAGVGVLPAYRRRGLAGQLTYALVCDALASGVTLVFCSAQTPEVARVYEAVGFRRVGTAFVAAASSLSCQPLLPEPAS